MDDAQLQSAITQWNERYGSEFGGDFQNAIKNSNLSDEDKHLILNFYNKGNDKRTAVDVEQAGRYLLAEYNNEWTSDRSAEFLDRFQAVIGGQGDAEKLAGTNLRTDNEWTDSYKDAFAPSGIVFESEKARLARAQDILTEGETSVASIVASDMQTGEESWNAIFDGDWTSQNPEHVDKILSGASERVRETLRGRSQTGWRRLWHFDSRAKRSRSTTSKRWMRFSKLAAPMHNKLSGLINLQMAQDNRFAIGRTE